MKFYLIIIISAFFSSLLLMIALLPVLKKLKAGQYILSYVKEHICKVGTPTMGGLSFITAIICVGLIATRLKDGKVNLTLAITCGFMVVGFLDDFLKIYRKENEGLKPYQKILFQLSIAAIAAVFCYVNNLSVINLPFSGSKKIDVGWGIIPITLFVFIATVNCVNLTDGLDGLAGSCCLVYLFVFAILLIDGGGLSTVCFAAVGALAAYLLFNTNKAAVFMGDTGSLALGGLISCVSVFSGNTAYIPIIGIMFVVSGISVIIQVIYYKRTRRRVFLMSPLHHHFQMKGYSESKISYAYSLITALTGTLSLLFM